MLLQSNMGNGVYYHRYDDKPQFVGKHWRSVTTAKVTIFDADIIRTSSYSVLTVTVFPIPFIARERPSVVM